MTQGYLDDDYSDAMSAATLTLERAGSDWPSLREAILRYGGIGPSRDWPRDWVPGDLYRVNGKAPDLVAAEAVRSAPWGDSGDDAAMLEYLRRSWSQWQRLQERTAANVKRRAPKVGPTAPIRGQRSFAELVSELKRKHGDGVDLSGLSREYVRAYETGERIEITRDGRTFRGTVGATRSSRPRFVLLLSLDL